MSTLDPWWINSQVQHKKRGDSTLVSRLSLWCQGCHSGVKVGTILFGTPATLQNRNLASRGRRALFAAHHVLWLSFASRGDI